MKGNPGIIPTVYDLKEEEYAKLGAPNVAAGLKAIREKLKEIHRSAESVVNGLFPFNFGDFEKEYILNNPSFPQRKAVKDVKVEGNYGYDVSQYAHRFPIFKELTIPAGTLLVTFRSCIDKLLRADRIGSAVCYQTSYYSFEKFRRNLLFTEVTVDYLNDYERWMLKQDYSKTTIGIYVRSLRTIFNEAIEDGIIKREKYSFGRRRYQIPTSRNVKKALTLEDVFKIYYYEPTCQQEQWAKDFGFFRIWETA